MPDYKHHISVETINQDLITAVKFGIFKAVTMENGVFWDVTPCILVGEYWHFGGS
jgi:hypothetical protein